MDDRELLERLRTGDRDAFDLMFRTHYASLVRVAGATVRDVDVAEEIVQDVMLELWRRRDALPFEDSIRPYLLRAVRNRALNHARHLAVRKKAEPYVREEIADLPATDSRLAVKEIQTVLVAAIAELPERCREVFELSRVQGLKQTEIAATLEISVKTVEAQMGKALRLLRERLAPWLEKG